MDSWLKGRGVRLKLGKRFVRLELCPLMCARSGTSLDCKSLRRWFESICALMSRSSNGEGNGLLSHPCGFDSCTRHFCFARSTEKDSSLLSRRCGFKSRAKHFGYVAKRLCSGLLTRQTQVRPLSCPLRSGDVTAAYRSSKPGVRVQSPFRASDQQKSWLLWVHSSVGRASGC